MIPARRPRAETILGLPVRKDRWNAVVTIKPEQAKAILEAQPDQRPVDQRTVDKRVEEIKAGIFVRTHQGIAFDADGLLFDGQHRLWACFMAGLPIEVLASFNEPRANFDIIDDGKPRTEGQKAMMKGHFREIAAANSGVAAARFIWAYDAGQNPVHAHLLKGFSSRTFDDVCALHPGIIEMTERLKGRRAVKLPLAPMIALFTMFQEADAGKAEVFLHQVLTGENLSADDPALTLRQSAMKGTATQRGARVDLSYRIARAWNGFVAGKGKSRLYGSNAPGAVPRRNNGLDPFPIIMGYKAPRSAAR
jgi:hypothetical protein